MKKRHVNFSMSYFMSQNRYMYLEKCKYYPTGDETSFFYNLFIREIQAYA